MSRASGVLVGERYELELLVGEGGFGEVWRARDNRLGGRASALKFLRSEFLDDPEVLRRFNNEAEALGMLNHPNIVAVEGRGEWEGQRFVAMEYIEGGSLAGWLNEGRRAGRLPDLDEVKALFDQVCAGVAAAHRVRAPGPIVHRDLKPENVMLRARSTGGYDVKVLDFGIARLGQRDGTQTGQQMGTQRYMAPEQADGRADRIGPWSDVFSLGVLLVEMLTLEVMPGKTDPWWAVSMRSRPIGELLERMRSGVPEGLWEVLARALRRETAARYADAMELGVALEPAWLTPKSTQARRALVKTRRNVERLIRWKSGRRLAGTVLAIGVAMLFPYPLDADLIQRPTCDEGDLTACVADAARYEDGSGGRSDMVKAAALYGWACDGGNRRGCLDLARMYARGLGMERDESRALSLRRGLCEIGVLRGCADLGEMYAEGRGVEKDEARAVQLYQRACDGRELRGCSDLGEMYEEGRAVAQDGAQAVALYRRACEGGDARGCGGLADSLVPHQFERAVSLYERACGGGYLASCAELATLYEAGSYVKEDDSRAGALYSKACSGGESSACFNLGRREARGETRSHRDRAKEYYDIACKGGYSQACNY